jgi:hypothetical protein
VEKNSIAYFNAIDSENLFNQWHRDVKKYTFDLNRECALEVIKNTEMSFFDISKYNEVLNLTNTKECVKILNRIVRVKNVSDFLNILKERDNIYPRYIKRGYSLEEILDLVKKNDYHPILFLELNKKHYIIDGRTRFYCCIFLNEPAKVRIISDFALNEKCKNKIHRIY